MTIGKGESRKDLEMYEQLWEYFVNFIENLLFYLFISINLSENNHLFKCKHSQIMFLIMKYMIVCLLNTFQINEIVTMTINALIGIIYTIIFYDCVLYSRILWASMFSVLTMFSEFATISIVKLFMGQNISVALYGGCLRVPLTMMYLALLAVLVFLSHQLSNKMVLITAKEKVAYFFISFSGIVIGHYIIGITLEAESIFRVSEFTNKLIFVSFFFLLLFMSLLLYIFLLGRSKEINSQLKEKEKIHELEALEYKNLIDTTKSLREMKHDINIHLNVMQSMITDCTKEELLEYIEKYHQTLEQTHKFISTGNVAIDCIVSSKIDTANSMGFLVDFSIIVPEDFPLDSLSTSSLLGNLWNNAIEACKKVLLQKPNSKPHIHFYIKPFKDSISIHIENSFDGNVKKDSKGNYLSTKKESGHGIGLSRVKDIVENISGYLQIHYNNNLFCVHILLPGKEVQNESENSHS